MEYVHDEKKHWIFPNKQSLLRTIKLSPKIKKNENEMKTGEHFIFNAHRVETVHVRYTLPMKLQRVMERRRNRENRER